VEPDFASAWAGSEKLAHRQQVTQQPYRRRPGPEHCPRLGHWNHRLQHLAAGNRARASTPRIRLSRPGRLSWPATLPRLRSSRASPTSLLAATG